MEEEASLEEDIEDTEEDTDKASIELGDHEPNT